MGLLRFVTRLWGAGTLGPHFGGIFDAGCGSRNWDPKSGAGAPLPQFPLWLKRLMLLSGSSSRISLVLRSPCPPMEVSGVAGCASRPQSELRGAGGCADPAAEGGEAGAAAAPQERADRRPEPAAAGRPGPAAVTGACPGAPAELRLSSGHPSASRFAPVRRTDSQGQKPAVNTCSSRDPVATPGPPCTLVIKARAVARSPPREAGSPWVHLLLFRGWQRGDSARPPRGRALAQAGI